VPRINWDLVQESAISAEGSRSPKEKPFVKKRSRAILPIRMVGVLLIAEACGFKVPLDKRAKFAFPATLRYSKEGITVDGVCQAELSQTIQALKEAVKRLEREQANVAT
jgi:hypothetical protein